MEAWFCCPKSLSQPHLILFRVMELEKLGLADRAPLQPAEPFSKVAVFAIFGHRPPQPPADISEILSWKSWLGVISRKSEV